MENNNSGHKELVLPLSTVLPAQNSSMAGNAMVTFRTAQLPTVQSGEFTFHGSVMEKKQGSLHPELSEEITMAPFPLFSAIAVLLIVLFRNLFHQSFTRYFVSLRNNYEIDFSIQKIGLPAIAVAVTINLLVFIDFIRIFRIDATSYAVFSGFQLLLFPMLVSGLVIFLFSFSIRFFPLIFPDIKILFLLSFVLLSANFFAYAQKSLPLLWLQNLPLILFISFLLLRSFYFFEVLGKFYRYRTTMSLFYICVLNLSTSLIIHKIWF